MGAVKEGGGTMKLYNFIKGVVIYIIYIYAHAMAELTLLTLLTAEMLKIDSTL